MCIYIHIHSTYEPTSTLLIRAPYCRATRLYIWNLTIAHIMTNPRKKGAALIEAALPPSRRGDPSAPGRTRGRRSSSAPGMALSLGGGVEAKQNRLRKPLGNSSWRNFLLTVAGPNAYIEQGGWPLLFPNGTESSSFHPSRTAAAFNERISTETPALEPGPRRCLASLCGGALVWMCGLAIPWWHVRT